MKQVWYISICLVLILLISGCTSTKELFIGNWTALQASQKVGTDEEIVRYNYWEVMENNKISVSSFFTSMENGIETKQFDKDNKGEYEYTWNSKDEIAINNKVYKIKISKNKMTISNNNIEVTFERTD